MYIINNEDYFKFIDSNKNLTKCQKNILKFFKEESYKFYVNVQSNQQMYTHINIAYKNGNIPKITKLILLFRKFMTQKSAVQLVNLIRKDKMKDTEIIEWIEKHGKNYNEPRVRENELHLKMCSQWIYIMEIISLAITKITNTNVNNFKYLDVGCGNGDKTKKLAKELKLKKYNVYGTDIANWGPYQQTKIKYGFNFKLIGKNGELNYNDNSFDLISCFTMLHHVDKLDYLISEMKRILKPNGLLLIIEHDIHDDYDHLNIDILHTLYGFFTDKNYKTITEPNFSQYFNWCEWNYIFSKNKFYYVESNYIFPYMSKDSRYDSIYYCIYKNIK